MSCPVCHYKEQKEVLKKQDFSLLKCRNCHLVFLDDSHEKDVKQYNYYRDRINLEKAELYNSITESRYLELLEKIECYRKRNEILDVGCGEGHFMSVAKTNNWKVTGIEKAVYAIEICKKFNLNRVYSDLLHLKKDHYDVVTMFEVLEHLKQPNEYLIKINEILRPGGVLIISTPNFNCLTRKLLKNRWSLINKEHLIYFTPYTIKSLLGKCNFKILEFKVKNINFPELSKVVFSESKQSYCRNQDIRKKIESNHVLSILKYSANKFLNFTMLGETIECIRQKQ